MFVRFDPATNARTAIADWTGQEDAQQVDADVREIVNGSRQSGPVPCALLQSTPVYMARLSGATGHTAEDGSDDARFIIYVDPFRATGRLHAASMPAEPPPAGRQISEARRTPSRIVTIIFFSIATSYSGFDCARTERLPAIRITTLLSMKAMLS